MMWAMRDFTKGPITKPLILFALPVLAGIVFQRMYNLFDIMLVGRYINSSALAAVGSSGIVFNTLLTFCMGFTNGFGIVIGQCFGSGDNENLKKALAGTYIFSILVAVLLTAFGLIFIDPILHIICIPEELLPQAKNYLMILTAGLILTVLYNTFANVLRAMGDSAAPLFFLIISVVLNIGFDLLFIVVLNRGVEGAAIATVIAQGISAVLCIGFCMLKRPLVRIPFNELRLSKEMSKQLLSQGAAMSLMFTVVDLGSVVLQAGINTLGKELIAGYVSGRKYLELLMIPGGAFASTSATFVSQNYGARQYDRIKKGVTNLILISWVWATAAVLISIFAGPSLVMSITGKDADPFIISAGLKYLRIGVPFYYALFILVIVRSSLQGINQKKLPLVASGIELFVKILSTAWLIPIFGYIVICLAEPIIWLLGMLWVAPAFVFSLKKLAD